MLAKDVRTGNCVINNPAAVRLTRLAYILAGEHGNNHSCCISINHVQIIRPSLARKNYDCHSYNSMARHNG